MITPHDIEVKRFKKATMGYNHEEVDDFLDALYADYSQIYKENAELNQKLSVVIEKLAEYKEREESFSNALIQAQKLSDTLIADAKRRAEIILQDAQIKADKLAASATTRVEQESEYYDSLKAEVSQFKEKVLTMYRQHIELLMDIPSPTVEAKAVKAEVSEQAEPAAEEPTKEIVLPKAEQTEQPAEPVKEEPTLEAEVKTEAEETIDEAADEETRRVPVIPDRQKELDDIYDEDDEEEDYDEEDDDGDDGEKRSFFDRLFGIR
ncbi:MAG: DivIVA domain-containing protein [Ruminococcaceae bacterium]|nr:DivIVA domain-containing protein [Oscillospiraceae bacterium]